VATPQLYIDGTLELSYIPTIDNIEVFVAGRRLKKSSYQLFQQEAINRGQLDPELASDDYKYPESPEGDRNFPAEFEVTGTSVLQLTELPFVVLPDTTVNKFEVVVVKRVGQTWDTPLTDPTHTNTDIIKFIKNTEAVFSQYLEDKYQYILSSDDNQTLTTDDNDPLELD
jgi:hypothetical protein